MNILYNVEQNYILIDLILIKFEYFRFIYSPRNRSGRLMLLKKTKKM